MSEIVRPDDMRRQNSIKVLAALRTHGVLSRTEIGQKTGLSAATVSAITADLLSNRVLLRPEDGDQTQSARGRPRVALSFNPDFAMVGTIVLQFNTIVVSIVNYQGDSILEKQLNISTISISSDELLQCMADALRSGLDECGLGPSSLKQITLGIQGTTDVENTMLLWSPITPHIQIPMQAYLAKQFNVPVSVHNDCNMIARALRWSEPELYCDDFAAILLSHGIGMGLYHNGELIEGKRSSATEFGHMVHIPDGALCRCGRRGCIEAYAGDYAIFRKANSQIDTASPSENITAEAMANIVEQARAGKNPAVAAFEDAGMAIGAGLESLFALIDQFPVAFIGAGANISDLLEKPIMRQINRLRQPDQTGSISMRYYPEECPLIRDGCAVTALMAVDENVPAKKSTNLEGVLNIVG